VAWDSGWLPLPLSLILWLVGLAGFVVLAEAAKVFLEYIQPIGALPSLLRDLGSMLPRRPRFPPAF
jgi:hypothetical protein